MFLCFFFLPCFASFLHLTGSSRGLEVWLLGGLLVPWAESFPWPWDLFFACDCVKCLDLKGLLSWQAYLMKKVSKFLSFLLAMFPP